MSTKDYIPTELKVKATALLNEEILGELAIPDPEKSIAEVLFESGTSDNNTEGSGDDSA
jgi:hypothetical protein